MGLRFRKSVKICKGVKINFSKSGASLSLGGRGHSINMGKRGTRITAGIPGTGLSYSSLIGKPSKKRNASSKSRSSSKSSVKIPSRIGIHMNENGQITIVDKHDREITDPSILKIIKDTPQFKAQKEILEAQRLERIAEIVRNAEIENEQFINICQLSPIVDSIDDFEERLNGLVVREYTDPEDDYDVSPPTEESIRKELNAEAKENVKGSFFTVGKLRKEYVEERMPQRLAEAMSAWAADRDFFYQEKSERKRIAEAEYQEEYENERAFLISLIDGDTDAVSEVFDSWIESCELPIEMGVNYDWDCEGGTLMLDIDLPEIEDLPDTIIIKTAGGKIKEKKKTQTVLREEYARLVFGLAIFISSNAFNTSPAIKKVLISGYTQRRDRKGNINDDYIYSLKFPRDSLEKRDVSLLEPRQFCMSVENRCNLTSTSVFKTIKPFETYE